MTTALTAFNPRLTVRVRVKPLSQLLYNSHVCLTGTFKSTFMYLNLGETLTYLSTHYIPILRAYLLTKLLTYLLTHLLTNYIFTYNLFAYCLPINVLNYLFIYLLYLLAFFLTYLLACLPTGSFIYLLI